MTDVGRWPILSLSMVREEGGLEARGRKQRWCCGLEPKPRNDAG